MFLAQIADFLAFDPTVLAEPAMILRLAIQACLLFGSAFFSGSETALFSLSDVDLEQLRRHRHPRSDLLHSLLDQPRSLIISILCGNELINVAATVNMTGILVVLYGGERAGLVSIIVMVPLLLLVGEITPKTIAVSYPVQVSTRYISAPLNVWIRLSIPIRWLIRLVAEKVTTWIVGEQRDIDHLLRMSEFRSLVAEIEEEGLVTGTDRVLIYNLLDAGNTEIVHIMTPRTQTQFVSSETKVSQVVDLLVKYQRLRVPVYEGTRDNIVGFIHAEDVMDLKQVGKEASDVTCENILRKPLFVPLTKSIDEMFDFFQSHNERAAMVLDEFGGISGIITMEDILNFVFGEIAGEFVNKYSYEQEDEQVFVVSGDMKLIDFEALTNFGIEDSRMTTIGGVVFRHLGRVPKEGDVITIEDIGIVVLKMEGNRIVRLRAGKIEQLEEKKHEKDQLTRSETNGGQQTEEF
ncbi:MAG: hemolysin family protein [Thermodesulfobacteriota bacterium]